MVFEPALTRQDWLGLVALGLLAAIFVYVGWVALAAAGRRSRGAFGSVLAICLLCGTGVGKLVTDRLSAFCEIEFTEREAIVRGVGSTVRLPLTNIAQVDMRGDGIRLVSGGKSAILPDSAQWAAENLVVGADYLANEFAGRAR
ncbi:MAG: hypothetical protein M3R13_09540 [Armatimonadota bacterium]|nr:hypothetical protein [Armatimonadota bacterium]